jgi:hypothetical protein
MIAYTFTKYFNSVFTKNTGITLDEDVRAWILATLSSVEPHKKIDNKGRPSEYFTTLIQEKPITIVCDSKKHVIVTAIIESHPNALAKVNLK